MEFEPNEMNMTGHTDPGIPPEPVGEAQLPAPDRRRARAIFSRLGIGVTLVLVLSSAVQLILAAVLERAAPGWRSWPYSMWLMGFAPLYLVGIPAGVLVARRAPAMPPEQGPMTVGRYFCIILICVFVMQAGNIFGLMVQGLIRLLLGLEAVNPIETFATDDSLLLRILFMVILAPLIEEFVFRKTLIDRMRPYGEKLAVVTSAAMFGLFHGNISQMFYAFTLGLVFGWVYLRTGKLRYTVGLHMIVNFFFGVLSVEILHWATPGLEAMEKMGTANAADLTALQMLGLAAYYLYTAAIFGAVIAGLVLLIVKGRRVRFQSAPLELPRGQRFSTVWINVGMILFAVLCAASIVLNIQ